MKRKIIVTTIVCFLIVMIGVVCLILFERDREISSMKTQAGYLIKKVEEYKAQHHKLPQYMGDMGLDLPDNYPFYYVITKDSSIYVVGFEIAPFKSMEYYSDSRTWKPQQ